MAVTVGKDLLYLTRADIEGLKLERNVLDLTRNALREHGLKKFEMPAKIGLHPKKDTLMHAMPAWVPEYKACGIKWAECFPDNYKHNLPQTSGLMILNCPETGWPIAIMDAIWVTAKRTAAVTAIACESLAKKDSEVVSMIGAGVQGYEHTDLFPRIFPQLKQVKIYDKFAESAKALQEIRQEKYPNIDWVVATDFENAVREANVVVSATAILSKANPVIKDEWIAKGAFIAPVDFDSLWEWKTFNRADKFLVDSLPEMEYFMTVGYLVNGLPKLHAELGEVVAGLKVGRERDDEFIIDMNIGMGVEDVVIGKSIYEHAVDKNVGRLLPL